MGSGNGVPDRFWGRDGGKGSIGKVGVDVHLARLLGVGRTAAVLDIGVVWIRHGAGLLKLEKQ